MPLSRLYQRAKLIILSDPMFSKIQAALGLCAEGISLIFVLWWASVLLTAESLVSQAIALPCLIFAVLTSLHVDFLIRMARQVVNLLTGVGALALVHTNSESLSAAFSFAKSHTGEIIVFTVLVALIAGIQLAFALFGVNNSYLSYRPRMRAPLIGPYTKLQGLDADFVAYHEAGHAVVLGLFPFNPHDIEVAMTAEVAGNTNKGWCSSHRLKTHCVPRDYAELDMIMLLAGREAELLFVGETSICGGSDNAKWLRQAKTYLLTDSSTIFYGAPATKLEFDHNTAELEKLKARHVGLARDLLLRNREVMEELRLNLLEKGIIKGPELAEILDKVQPIPCIPPLSDRLTKALEAEVQSRLSD